MSKGKNSIANEPLLQPEAQLQETHRQQETHQQLHEQVNVEDGVVMGDIRRQGEIQQDVQQVNLLDGLEATELREENLTAVATVFTRPNEINEITAAEQLIKQPLSREAQLRRNSFVHGMKDLTEKEREALVGDASMTLQKIIDKFVSEKEKKESAKRAKEHLKEFDELRKALSDDPVMSYVEKAKALFHFAKTFDHDLAIFRT
nr:hypothetical protein [Lachnospiraceae bacterium]